MTTTNFTVMQSDLILTIDSTPTGAGLYEVGGSVYGTVSDPTATVTVNGVAATVYADEIGVDGCNYWEADNVPIYGQGTATFNAVANVPGQPSAATLLEVERDAQVIITTYHLNKTASTVNSAAGQTYTETRTKDYVANYATNSAGQWGLASYQGTMTDLYQYQSSNSNADFSQQDSVLWSDLGDEMSVTNSDGTSYYYPFIYDDDYGQFTGLPDEDLWQFGSEGEADPQWVYHYWALNVNESASAGGWTASVAVTAKTELTLFTGGKSAVHRQNVIQLQCGATEYGSLSEYANLGPDWFAPWVDADEPPMDVTSLTVMGNHPNTNGNAYVILPDNAAVLLNLSAPGVQHYNAWATPTKYHSYFEIFDEQANPGGVLPTGANNVGHAFWRLTTEAPSDALQYISPALTNYLNHCWGFYPTNDSLAALFILNGNLQNDDGTVGSADIQRKFYIGFPNLLNGLIFTKGFADAPPVYTLLVYDCVDAAIEAAAQSGVKFASQQYGVNGFNGAPQYLPYYLAGRYPGLWLGNTNIFNP